MAYDPAAHPLDAGSALPPITLDLTGGSTMRLPDGLDGRFGILLIYRGAW